MANQDYLVEMEPHQVSASGALPEKESSQASDRGARPDVEAVNQKSDLPKNKVAVKSALKALNIVPYVGARPDDEAVTQNIDLSEDELGVESALKALNVVPSGDARPDDETVAQEFLLPENKEGVESNGALSTFSCDGEQTDGRTNDELSALLKNDGENKLPKQGIGNVVIEMHQLSNSPSYENPKSETGCGWLETHKKTVIVIIIIILSLITAAIFLTVIAKYSGRSHPALYNKDQPPMQNVTTPMQNLMTPAQNMTTPMQNFTRLNCSTSSLDKVRWLNDRATIAKYGNLNQTSAKKCGLNMTDSRNLIIVLPHKCPGKYTCEIEGHLKIKSYQYLVKEDSAELISDT